MRIECRCGAQIIDQTDFLPHKAHIIPDQEWFHVLDAIDQAIERSGPSDRDKEAAIHSVRSLLIRVSRSAWQCGACGRLYVDDQGRNLREFIPGPSDGPRELFRTRPSPDDDG